MSVDSTQLIINDNVINPGERRMITLPLPNHDDSTPLVMAIMEQLQKPFGERSDYLTPQ